MSVSLSYRPSQPRLAGAGLLGRDEEPYFAHPDLLAAANAALELQMPLLLTGEAVCGKTDFAFAAASGLGRDREAGPDTTKVLECYVRSDSRARDLLYHYDAIRRFGDAQHGGEPGLRRAEDPRPYLKLQPFGRALMSPDLRVVLIDEIDKAPRDLPNDLLRELDQGHFEIPEIPAADEEPAAVVDAGDPMSFRNQMKRPRPKLRPLVIITSNVERQLPNPFLRRCVFYDISFPSEDQLRMILRSRFEEPEEQLINRVIDVFEALRAVPALSKRPATCELINWTQVLCSLHEPAAVLRLLDEFAGGKLPQARAGTQSIWVGTDRAEDVCSRDNVADASTKVANTEWTVFPCDDSFPALSPVGSIKGNRWLLFDLGGNVAEWVWDGYGPYPEGPVEDPSLDEAPYRVFRGGSWRSYPRSARVASRPRDVPSYRFGVLGFRVARSILSAM